MMAVQKDHKGRRATAMASIRFRLGYEADRKGYRKPTTGAASEVRKVAVTPEIERAALQALEKSR
jgi:hypothetical protein